MKDTKDINWEDIGKLCRKLRMDKCLSMNELGKLMGVSGTIIWRIEHGLQPPSLKKLEKVCEFLGVDKSVAEREVLSYKKKLLMNKYSKTISERA